MKKVFPVLLYLLSTPLYGAEIYTNDFDAADGFAWGGTLPARIDHSEAT
jgi:hypothetical protein